MRMEKSFFLFLNFVFVSGFKNTFGVYYPDYKKQEDFKWGNALNVMTYHRDKMNEYLCKSYIAREIVEGFRNLSKGSIDKRNGRPQRSLSVARESLLADQGSKKYKDWLSR